jgi:monoamine oxidase
VKNLDADVCVIGAGFAGLTAALRLHQAGLAVVVLEAADRVGGRTYTQYLSDGTAIDRGGAWLGPGQDRAYALAAEMGVATYPTWVRGENILLTKGVARRYHGTVPLAIGPLQLANLALAMARLDRLATKVPLEAPWEAPRARRWDARTLGAWLEHNVLPGTGRALLTQALTDIFTSDLAEVSLLQALFLIHSHKNLTHLTSVEGGAQQDRVVGGTGAVLACICAWLGDAICLSSPVREVTQSQGGVVVVAAERTVRARRAVVAVPAAVSSRIAYTPPLPIDRAQLMQRMPLGAIWKIAVVYDAPWWREDGLTGQSLDAESPLPLTLDACAATAPPGILNLFSAGPSARQLTRLTPAARRTAVLETLTSRFGAQAGRPTDYVEQDWTAEPWIAGGMFSRLGPGVLTAFGPALREPVGRVHWAGTETATITHGGIDGAIRSGERAAREVVLADQR